MRIKYKSEARILLVGAGADEQCAGYGRHRTKYRNGRYVYMSADTLSYYESKLIINSSHMFGSFLYSWLALDQEMKLDMQRIWKRNLGRDDRCIADNGKEVYCCTADRNSNRSLWSLLFVLCVYYIHIVQARFPFLDEDVIKTLLDIPLWEIADLEQPSGKGDKKILRQVK